jgi:hypothetical protein
MSVRIEGYITFKNYSSLEQMREKTKDKGFSNILNHVINKYFVNLDEQQGAVERLTKVIQGYQEKINNLEYELKEKKIPPAPPKEKKDKELKNDN